MLAANIPPRFPAVWAYGATPNVTVRSIPTLSQTLITPGAASLQDGFPPLCFTPIGGGGIPPFGQDTNGILKQITQWSQWAAAGGPVFYDNTFATSAQVNGYPAGAVLSSSLVPGLLWRSTVDNNTTNPDSTSSANWVQVALIGLGGPTTFYVNASTGNDATGTGMIGAPWQTLQRAFDVFQKQYHFQNQAVTVQLADGTYTNAATLNGGISGLNLPANLTITGNSGSPGNVIYTAPISLQYAGAMLQVQNFKMQGSYGIETSYGATAQIGGGMVWGTMSGYHIYGNTRGNVIIAGSYSIVGGASAHISMLGGSYCAQNGGLTWTLSGSPAFGAFVIADGASVVSAASSTSHYSGAAGGSGSPANVTATSLVYGTGGNNSYFPGFGAPITGTLGQYL